METFWLSQLMGNLLPFSEQDKAEGSIPVEKRSVTSQNCGSNKA